MKNLVFIFFLLFVYSLSFAQTKNSLYINVKDCRTKKQSYVSPNFSLYKDNLLIRKINLKNQNSRIFTDLEYGEYKLEYYTLFGSETLTINISKNNNIGNKFLCLFMNKFQQMLLFHKFLDYESIISTFDEIIVMIQSVNLNSLV